MGVRLYKHGIRNVFYVESDQYWLCSRYLQHVRDVDPCTLVKIILGSGYEVTLRGNQLIKYMYTKYGILSALKQGLCITLNRFTKTELYP